YATHQLENGLPVHKLQQQLGHRNIRSTLRYVHWVSGSQDGLMAVSDLIGELEVHND
ncbi:MAG: tyrosine-type recombinase/integrase, partial [Pseudomonadota bacterium]